MSTAPLVIEAAHLADGETAGAGWVRVEGDAISGRGEGRASEDARRGAHVIGSELVTPGLVDIHVHGARGVDFAEVGADPSPAIAHHRAAGSTSLLASLATGRLEATAQRLRELHPLVSSGELAGVHLEGPWLSRARRGAHAPELLRPPNVRELDMLLDAGGGAVRMVTLAPELPGALETIRALRTQGVVAAIGHTDADAAITQRAMDAGATIITHLFNGMRPLHHRDPGPIGAALARDAVAVELIADGVHVDDLVADLVFHAAADRLVLVSDAMAATGLGDGAYELAGSRVVVTDGVARLADGSSLAGSTRTLGDIVRRALTRGVPATALVAAAAVRPAALLGLPAPSLQVGATADLVVFGADGVRAMKAGRWLAS